MALCVTTGCNPQVQGSCTLYSGAYIAGAGINYGDTMDTTINKLKAYVDLSSGNVTGATLGLGAPVFASKIGTVMNFKSIIAGTNITLLQTGNDITISAATTATGSSIFYGNIDS